MKKIKALIVTIIVGLSSFTKGYAATPKKKDNTSKPNIFKRWYRNASESSTNMFTGVKATMQGPGETLKAIQDTANKIKDTSAKLDETTEKANVFFDGTHKKLGQLTNKMQGTLQNVDYTMKQAQNTFATMQKVTKQTQGTLVKVDTLVTLLQVLTVVAIIRLIVPCLFEASETAKKRKKIKKINQIESLQ